MSICNAELRTVDFHNLSVGINQLIVQPSEIELKSSVLGMIGGAPCRIFQPLGFGNIKATIATIMGLVFAVAALAFLLYMLFKPYQGSTKLTKTVKVSK